MIVESIELSRIRLSEDGRSASAEACLRLGPRGGTRGHVHLRCSARTDATGAAGLTERLVQDALRQLCLMPEHHARATALRLVRQTA